MQSKHVLIGILLCLSFLTHGQKPYYNQRPEFIKANNHWVMPGHSIFEHPQYGTLLVQDDGVAMNFSSGTVVFEQTSLVSHEGAAAVSDPVTGQLLFYSNGEQCWSANGNTMPNGDGLLGNSSYTNNRNGYRAQRGENSTCQGVCIVPVIGTPGEYYLFSLAGLTHNAGVDYSKGALFYSVVDMKLNNGLGDIDPGRKNIRLIADKQKDTLSEAMIAIPGDNCDIWLMVHGAGKGDFFAHRISKDGIDTTPVISNVQTSIDTIYGGILKAASYSYGFLAKSPDRKKIALVAPFVSLLCEFDPKTGRVSNPIELQSGAGFGNYGEPCFSPDNSKLYVGDVDSIFQFDISVYNASSINSSVRAIGANSHPDTLVPSYAPDSKASFRLYKDKIYVTFGANFMSHPYICRINNPNLSGNACGFEENALKLPVNTFVNNSLGNEVVFSLPPDDTFYTQNDAEFCNGEMMLKPATVYESRIWSDGSTGESIMITETGTYWVTQNDGCHFHIDTFIIKAYQFVNPPVITVDKRLLGTTKKYITYQWMFNRGVIPNATDSVFTVQDGGNGDYQVIVSDGKCVDTSDIYKVTNAGGTNISGTHHVADRIQIYPNPTQDVIYIQSDHKVNILITSIEGKVLRKERDVNNISVGDLTEGIYFLQVLDQKDGLMKVIKFIKTK